MGKLSQNTKPKQKIVSEINLFGSFESNPKTMEQYNMVPYTQINPLYNAINVSDSNCPSNKIEQNSENNIHVTAPPTATCNCAGLEKKMEDINVNMQQKLNGVQGQIKLVLESLEEQKEMLQELLKTRDEALLEQALPLHTKFPLQTEQQLIRLNDELNPENRNLYLKAIESLLHPEGIRKNLKNILSTEITVDYNIDGVQGKKSFRTLENFYTLLLDSIPVTSTSGTAEVQLRKAIQLQKKRYLKKVSLSKHAYDDDVTYDSDFDEKPISNKRFRQHDPLEFVVKPKEKDKEATIFAKFPVNTEKQLIELNAAITPGNRSLYIKVIKSLLHPEGIRKNLRNIIGNAITHDYNVEGVHNKKSFRALSTFYRTLIDSITVTCESGTAEVQLRNAIHLQKKRHFKNISVMKRKLRDD